MTSNNTSPSFSSFLSSLSSRIRNRLIENPYFIGMIIRPSGTGKLITTVSFILGLNLLDWQVTWIHLLDRFASPECVRMTAQNGQSMKKILSGHRFDDFEEHCIENDADPNKNHIVFLDGCVDAYPPHYQYLSTVLSWLRRNWERRRLVIVCSMARRGIRSYDEWMTYGYQSFLVHSWSKEEFARAMKNKTLFESVRSIFPFNDSPDEKRYRKKHTRKQGRKYL